MGFLQTCARDAASRVRDSAGRALVGAEETHEDAEDAREAGERTSAHRRVRCEPADRGEQNYQLSMRIG